MVNLGGQAGRADLVEARVFVDVERKAIGADGAVKDDRHLVLLLVVDGLHLADKPGALGQQQLLVVVGVVVGREHDQDWPRHAGIGVIGYHTLKDRPLEDAIELPAELVEVVRGHRVLVLLPRLLIVLPFRDIFGRIPLRGNRRRQVGRSLASDVGRGRSVLRFEINGNRVAIQRLEALPLALRCLLVYPARMQRNLDSTGGLIFSGQLLLELTESGMSREDAYRLVQQHAMAAWAADDGPTFRDRVAADPAITTRLTPEKLAQAFDLQRQLTNVDAIFARVFSTYDRHVADGEIVQLVGGKVRL